MGDLKEYWDDVRPILNEDSKKKKIQNQEQSIILLEEKGIEYKQLSPTHFRVGLYDFWPSTGRFIHMKTKERGRGVFNLIRNISFKEYV